MVVVMSVTVAVHGGGSVIVWMAVAVAVAMSVALSVVV